jgi:hypothetical protein
MSVAFFFSFSTRKWRGNGEEMERKEEGGKMRPLDLNVT